MTSAVAGIGKYRRSLRLDRNGDVNGLVHVPTSAAEGIAYHERANVMSRCPAKLNIGTTISTVRLIKSQCTPARSSSQAISMLRPRPAVLMAKNQAALRAVARASKLHHALPRHDTKVAITKAKKAPHSTRTPSLPTTSHITAT